MVYVYGGSFANGDSSMYSETGIGGNIATNDRDDIIFIVFNYRIGVFGFLALDVLADENPAANTTGNYGIQDQRFAFEWVQRNVASFGGDPSRVTIAGESAGAISIGGHLMSKQTRPGTFQAAFLESGTTAFEFATREAAVAMGESVAACAVRFYGSHYYTGTPVPACHRVTSMSVSFNSEGVEDAVMANMSDLDCMRAMAWEDLLFMTANMIHNTTLGCNGNTSFSFTPVIDGYEWTDMPLNMAEGGGAIRDVAVMIGDVENEGRLFALALLASTPSTLAFDAALAAMWSFLGHGVQLRQGVEALELYHPSKFEASVGNLSTWAALAAMAGDALFQCANRRLARALVKGGQNSVYFYEFQHAPTCWTPAYPPIQKTLPILGVFHECDLPYFFATAQANSYYTRPCAPDPARPFDPLQVQQCGVGTPVPDWASICPLEPSVLQAYFGIVTAFVRRTGDPNPTGAASAALPHWPAFNEAEARMGINVTSALLERGTFDGRVCDFWDGVDLDALLALLRKHHILP